ncbi:hypothetical protein QYE76_068018 [Lolium multiflorum]|uniref:Gag-pol polyprotein n=1 Tax=Lolium multiflorum TaxID=4521 RepID=A0AAD8SEM3_LOLMU|nr:hypothetical protein QYE76_068018 [Lolium multiflorum]
MESPPSLSSVLDDETENQEELAMLKELYKVRCTVRGDALVKFDFLMDSLKEKDESIEELEYHLNDKERRFNLLRQELKTERCISQGLKQQIETFELDKVKDLETIERAQLLAQELDASKKELEVAHASLTRDLDHLEKANKLVKDELKKLGENHDLLQETYKKALGSMNDPIIDKNVASSSTSFTSEHAKIVEEHVRLQEELSLHVETNTYLESLVTKYGLNYHPNESACEQATILEENARLTKELAKFTTAKNKMGLDDLLSKQRSNNQKYGLGYAPKPYKKNNYKKEKPAQEKNKKVTSNGKASKGKATSGDRTGPNNHYDLFVDYYGDVYAKYVGPRNGYAYRGYSIWGYSSGGPKWVFDSGCTNHMTGGRGVLDQFIEDINKKSSITFGDNSKGKVLGYGKVAISKDLSDNLKLVLVGYVENNLYVVDLSKESPSPSTCLMAAKHDEGWLWHRRLGHVNMRNLKQLLKGEHIVGLTDISFEKDRVCSACVAGKQLKKSHPIKSIVTTSRPLELLHLDLFGPSHYDTLGGSKYGLVIVDDYSRYSWVFLLKSKDETHREFIIFAKKAQRMYESEIKAIRTDNGTEFKNYTMQEFVDDEGIKHEFSAPYTPQQNGNKPNIMYIRVFGCKCLVKNNKGKLGKSETRTIEGTFVGYAENSHAYRQYNKSTGAIEVSCDVVFLEDNGSQVEQVVPCAAGDDDPSNAIKLMGIGHIRPMEVHSDDQDMASSINFNQFLEKEKLKSNGSNFTDWFRHVRIFLNGGNLQYVLDAPLGDPPAETETDEVKNVYMTRKTRYSQVQCAILCSLESDLQKRFEHHDPHELIKELKTIFETHAAVECYEASKHFFSCMMEEGSSISEHMLVMTGHAKKLSDLGIVIPNRLGINRVLQSLPPSYKNFVMNYNMQNMNKEFPELFGMLKAAEIEIKKEHQVLMVNKTTSFKKQGKSKGKNKKSGKKAATPPVKPKSGPKPDAECYYCKEKGHWKRNCSKYLADLKSGLIKKKKEGISDIHVIDVYLTSSRSSTWVFDTGSVAHICNSKQELKNKRQLLKDEVTMRVGNGSKVNVIAVGTLPLHLPSGLVLSLNNCYYVPALSMNIISGSCLMQDGYSFKSENNGCSIFMNNIFYGRAPQKNGLFLLDLDSSNTHIHNIDAKRIKLNDNSTYMWHCRLGHIGVKRMKKLHTDGLLESLDFESLDRCEACLMGKMTKTPFSGMMERATDLLEIIHTDVCGPMSVASRGGYRYVLTFTDDLSRYGYIYLMKHKSETFEKFKEFQSEVENQRNKKIKFLRSDRGGEYLSYEFSMHLKKCGILSQLTPPGTPQRNGVSERRNRTLLDMVRSMMSLTDLPLSFWSYALETAAFTLNRAPSKSVETTPYELWFNKKPKLSFLKVWGCEAYVKKLQPDKLEPKAEKCVFIGYPKETIGYTFYHRSEGKIFVAKNGTFLEKEFLTKEVTRRKVELDEIEESLLVDQSSAVPENVPVPPTPTTEEANDNDHETSYETATEPRRSTRDRATPDWYDPCLNVMIVDNNDEDPATYEEAMMSPDSNKWQEAMKSEMGSMYDNKVWTLVDLPDSRKAVENKWIFKRKTDADGNITVYKARLVAKGFRQIQGVDYDETFSPVAKLKSVRILLAIAAFFDYEIWQMDVKTAFLNGDIEEELYMVQPKGFVDPKNADKVCKLQRSIYGLKQASRSWNRRFDKVIKDFGFIQCHGEACIYKKVSGSSVAFLILYVDDILLIGNDIELLSSVKGYLNNSFSMKDLGEASYILGIKIYRDRSRRLIGLSQSTYLDKILKKFRMDESKKGFLPMLPGKVLSKTQGPATAEERERMSQIPYASAVGSIMYAMLCTRPDIAHAVSLTSRYQSDPGMEHWTAVKNILKYLKRTKDMFLCYGGDQELVVTSYTDASWNTDPDDSKSQSGYVFILNGAAVSWASSKQCTVAKSSTESEYIAASEASSEAVWMKRFIVELGVVPSALDPFVIYCDNMGAIANAQEPRSHKRLKHIKLRYHSIREYIEDGEVKICKVHTDLNVADPLTKALPRAKHDQHQNAMGVRNPTQEIFSELDETNAQGLIFPRSFQKTEEDTKWGHGAPTPHGRAASMGPAPPYGVGPRASSDSALPPTYTLRRENPITESHDTEKFRDAAAANPISGDSGDRLRHPAGEGNHHRRTLHHHDRLRIDV